MASSPLFNILLISLLLGFSMSIVGHMGLFPQDIDVQGINTKNVYDTLPTTVGDQPTDIVGLIFGGGKTILDIASNSVYIFPMLMRFGVPDWMAAGAQGIYSIVLVVCLWDIFKNGRNIAD